MLGKQKWKKATKNSKGDGRERFLQKKGNNRHGNSIDAFHKNEMDTWAGRKY